MSEIRRDAAKDRKLCQSTTTGEWTNKPTGQRVSGFTCDVIVAACPGRNNVYSVPAGGQFPADDARFIAEAHQALPHWIDRAEKAEALLAEAAELLDDMCELCTEADVCDPEECNCTTMVRKIERMLSLPDPTKEVPSILRTPSGMSCCPAERQQQYTPLTAEDYEDLHRMATGKEDKEP